VVLISPHGEVVESSSSEPLYVMIRRYEFDAALLQKCRDGGIEIREQCAVAHVRELTDRIEVETTSGEHHTSRLLIGADGVNSVVAIESGLRGNWDAAQLAIDGTEESCSAPQKTRHMGPCLK
jgi:2-polyprenyl-6-methoxyphenol hydroxylase-like FAD-dependent oxidoreductase